MTKYRLDKDPDTGRPCIVADQTGIYYSVGEVDRAVKKRDVLIVRMARHIIRTLTWEKTPDDGVLVCRVCGSNWDTDC